MCLKHIGFRKSELVQRLNFRVKFSMFSNIIYFMDKLLIRNDIFKTI